MNPMSTTACDCEPSISAIDLGSRPIRQTSLRSQTFDGEAVLYDVAHHTVHHLNATAFFIWSRCDGHRQVSRIVRDLLDEFELVGIDEDPHDRAAHDVVATLTQLLDVGLIELCEVGDA
jgi:hypothetical protein